MTDPRSGMLPYLFLVFCYRIGWDFFEIRREAGTSCLHDFNDLQVQFFRGLQIVVVIRGPDAGRNLELQGNYRKSLRSLLFQSLCRVCGRKKEFAFDPKRTHWNPATSVHRPAIKAQFSRSITVAVATEALSPRTYEVNLCGKAGKAYAHLGIRDPLRQDLAGPCGRRKGRRQRPLVYRSPSGA